MPGKVYFGDCRDVMREMIDRGEKVQMCVTSPPYFGLRDYGVDGQIGLEEDFRDFLNNLVDVFSLVWELLEDDGICWINMGDSYASNGGAGYQGKNGQRADRGFTAVRDTDGMRSATRRPPLNLKPKDLVGQPWRLAFALQDWGWWLRQDVIWHKPNPMPESVTDRCTKSHEYLFLLAKFERYYFDADAIKEPASNNTHARRSVGTSTPKPGGWDMTTGEGRHGSIHREGKTQLEASPKYQGAGEEHRTKAGLAAAERKSRPRKTTEAGSGVKNNQSFDEAMAVMVDTRNKRSVWTVGSQAYSGAHFATFPPALIKPCILAGSKPGDIVLDPFLGSGTTGQVCNALGRNWVGIELNRDYEPLQLERTAQQGLEL